MFQMMGTPRESPVHVHGDNQSTLCNIITPESTLKKKFQSLAYQLIHEGTSRHKWFPFHANTNDNKKGLLTNVLPCRVK